MSVCTCTPKQKASGKHSPVCDAHMGFRPRKPRGRHAHANGTTPRPNWPLTPTQLRALTSIEKASDSPPPMCYAICPTKERRRRDVEMLHKAGLIHQFHSGLHFAGGVSTMQITQSGRALLRKLRGESDDAPKLTDEMLASLRAEFAKADIVQACNEMWHTLAGSILRPVKVHEAGWVSYELTDAGRAALQGAS